MVMVVKETVGRVAVANVVWMLWEGGGGDYRK